MDIKDIRPLRGIAFKVLSAAQITLLLAMVKAIEGLPLFEVMFFRLFFATVLIAIVLSLKGNLVQSVKTKRPFAHLTRSMLAMVNMGFTFLAVRYLPLPEAVTLQYTQPLFVVALSALFLSAKIGLYRWAAVGIGFVGVLIMTWPKLSLLSGGLSALSRDDLLGVGAALGAAITIAFTLLWVAELVRTERSTTVAIWMGIYGSAMLLITVPYGWSVPGPMQLGMLVLSGALGAGGQLALTECLRSAPASTTAPFEYSSLIFAGVIGYLAFGDLPDANTLAGGALLVIAGCVIIWRERYRAA